MPRDASLSDNGCLFFCSLHREILLNQTEIRLYLAFSEWFGIKRTLSFWFQVNRCMVNTIWFRVDLKIFLCVCSEYSEYLVYFHWIFVLDILCYMRNNASCTQREILHESCWIKPKSDRICHFPNQSENGRYNLILVWFKKNCLCVSSEYSEYLVYFDWIFVLDTLCYRRNNTFIEKYLKKQQSFVYTRRNIFRNRADPNQTRIVITLFL